MAEVHIDIRKLLQFLAGQQVNPTRAVCNLVSNKIIHFDLLHEDVSLQYFIPALSYTGPCPGARGCAVLAVGHV